MARHSEDTPAASKRASAPKGALARHLSGRLDPLTSAILVFPLFVVYQVGILTSRGRNGVDFVTEALVELCERDLGNYLALLAVLLVSYAAVLMILRQRSTFTPNAFVPTLLEAGFYALTMGSLILYVMHRFVEFVPGLAVGTEAGFTQIVVISAGAGLHEELVFRVGGVSGLSWLFAGLTGKKRAWIAALVVSSLIFSIAHHIGPRGEDFTFAAFVYRSLAGAFFGVIYQVRGFAVAVWTHALYDIYVFSLA